MQIRRLLGADPRQPADHRRDHADCDQRSADHRRVYIFAGVLVIQSLPFLSALPALPHWKGAGSTIFAFWAELQPRLVSGLASVLQLLTAAQAPVLANAIVEGAGGNGRRKTARDRAIKAISKPKRKGPLLGGPFLWVFSIKNSPG